MQCSFSLKVSCKTKGVLANKMQVFADGYQRQMHAYKISYKHSPVARKTKCDFCKASLIVKINRLS